MLNIIEIIAIITVIIHAQPLPVHNPHARPNQIKPITMPTTPAGGIIKEAIIPTTIPTIPLIPANIDKIVTPKGRDRVSINFPTPNLLYFYYNKWF
jgi:hypothetical protein